MSVAERYRARLAEGALTPDPAQALAVDALEQVRRNLAEQRPPPARRGFFSRKTAPLAPPKGLYLWGGVGRGKSMLMDMAVAEMGVPTRRSHFHAFMQWVHDRMAAARATGVDDAIRPVAEELAAEIRLLAFDEMQITDVADAMIVGRLFEGLFARGVCIITTSNRPPDELYKNGLNRQLFLPFIEALKSHLHVHELVSETDYRQEVLAGQQVYFSPLGAAARARMDAIWANLTGGAAAPHSLIFKGRELRLPAFHAGCARASFFDLCGAMLGPGDYLKIAESLRLLMLDDIPQLGRANFNEAKRFVTLVDALYEARVRLICSAAADPELLYLEGEGAFEFQRTASRLREMGGAEWGLSS